MPYKIADKTKRIEKINQELDRILKIIKNAGAEKAILFGSSARGDIDSKSDIDLIIIKKTDKPFLKRLEEFYAEINPNIAMDILVYTPEEFEDLKTKNPFIFRAISEGKIIYES